MVDPLYEKAYRERLLYQYGISTPEGTRFDISPGKLVELKYGLGKRVERGYWGGRVPTRRWRKQFHQIQLKQARQLVAQQRAYAKWKARELAKVAETEKGWGSYEKQVKGWRVLKPAVARRQLRMPRVKRVRISRRARAEQAVQQAELRKIAQTRTQLGRRRKEL